VLVLIIIVVNPWTKVVVLLLMSVVVDEVDAVDDVPFDNASMASMKHSPWSPHTVGEFGAHTSGYGRGD